MMIIISQLWIFFLFWESHVQNASKHQGRHSISLPLSHLRPVPICSFAFRALHARVLLFLVHLLHPLTAENEERRTQLHSDSAARETSCNVTLCAKKKSANGKWRACWGAVGMQGYRPKKSLKHVVGKLFVWPWSPGLTPAKREVPQKCL